MSKEYLRDHVGQYPVYSSQTARDGEFGRIDSYDFDGEYLTWTTDGANAGSVFYRKGKFSITNVCGLIKVTDDEVDVKFLSYVLKVAAKEHVSPGMGNAKLMSNVMADVKVMIPHLSEQKKIAVQLDAFSAIVSALDEEIAARREQFAGWLEKLMEFKEAA